MRFYHIISFAILLGVFNPAVVESRSVRIKVVDIWTGQPVPFSFTVVQNDTLYADNTGTIVLPSHCPKQKYVRIQAADYFAENLKCPAANVNVVYLTPVNQTPFITVVRSKLPSRPLNIPSHQTYLDVQTQPVFDGSIADVLQGQSGVFIKSYGPEAALKTIAVRSMSAEQTQVSFDGIPLNNLQLGSADLSLFPADDLAGIELYRGSNVLLGGSGAIGGSLNLNPLRPARRLSARARIAYSSLKNKQLNAQIHVPILKYHLRTLFTFYHANGLNCYQTVYQGKKVPLRNRDFVQNHLSYQIRFTPNRSNRLRFFVSHFRRHAGAPRAFTNPVSEASNAARLSSDNTLGYLRWQHGGEEAGFYVQIYSRNEWMTYDDPGLMLNFRPLHSIHFNKEQGLQVRFHYSPRQTLLLKSGVEMANQAVNSSQAGKHQRQRQAVYLLVDWLAFENESTSQAFHLNGGIRTEHYGGHASVVMPVIGAGYNYRRMQIYTSAGQNYRLPSFNDLYWVPGGNQNLKPEYSRNFEIGLRQLWPVARWLGRFEISLYRNDVKDKIRWLPESSGYWTPRNIARVRSRGIEIDVQLGHVNNRDNIRFSYTFGRATKQSPEIPGDRTVDNQLPYLPQEQWSFAAQTGWRRWRTGILVQKTGFRYLDFSNEANAILPSFTTARWWLRTKIFWGMLQFQPEVSVENLTNKRYEVIKGFPMPQRYVRLGCTFEFKTQGNR